MNACHDCTPTHNRDVRERGRCWCPCHSPVPRESRTVARVSDDDRFYGDHLCRSRDHDWDEPAVGAMFQPPVDAYVVSTCRSCGVVRTYDHGAVTYRFPDPPVA